MTTFTSLLPSDYNQFLLDLKQRIRAAQVKAAVSVNRELVALYWDIGRAIALRQEQAGWGDSVVEQVARDLRQEFPGVAGFSRSNIFAMRQVYLAYREEDEKVQQLVGQIPWGHNLLLVSKVKDPVERVWYAAKTVEHGWSRAILEHQIETSLYARQVTAEKTSNFELTLPPPQSDLARQMLKDTYLFDFLTLREEAEERELEQALVTRITQFLLELGAGFAFMGSQYPLEVAGKDFYLDLLFYHHRLRCLVAIDLKMREFEPEFAGKMNFYLAALDDLVRHPEDQPSIGIILCKSRNKTLVEYSLRDLNKPIGVAEHRLTKQLPQEIAQALPTAAEFERMLDEAAPTDEEA
jgi:predicted nuclease of restriction endonuclease-like (RecB) superfamily